MPPTFNSNLYSASEIEGNPLSINEKYTFTLLYTNKLLVESMLVPASLDLYSDMGHPQPLANYYEF